MPPTRQVGQFWRAAVLSLMPSSRASAARGCNISPFGSSMAGRSSLVSRCGSDSGAVVVMSVTAALPSTRFRQGHARRCPSSDNVPATGPANKVCLDGLFAGIALDEGGERCLGRRLRKDRLGADEEKLVEMFVLL